MYFQLIMIVVAVYICGLTLFTLYQVLADKRKTWGLRLAQSFCFVCLGTVTVLFVLWMPHVHDIIAVFLAISFVIVPILFIWSAGFSQIDKQMAYLKIEDACKAKNITLKDLSRLSGISERSLEWYVKQQREPSLSRVEKLAKVLEVSPAWLVSWE